MNKTKETTQEVREEPKTNWILIALLKAHIIKRTDKYIIFNVDGVASGIITTKFLRKKEHEDKIFLSVPENYEINCNVREQVNGKWTTKKSYSVKAVELKSLVDAYNKKSSKPEDQLPF